MSAVCYRDLKGQKVGVCVSGASPCGAAPRLPLTLRTPAAAGSRRRSHVARPDCRTRARTVSKRLVEAGIEVLAFSADLGQPDETDINNVRVRMATCGVDTIIIDLKDDMAEGCFDVIQAQAKYDGGYWNTTGIGRFVTCRGLVRSMLAEKVTVLSHGATGRGNDQMRFERYTNVLAPQMKVYAPWRDPELLDEFPGRAEMVAYLTTFGIEAFVGPKKKYSTDANLAGLSHEAEDLESVETPMTIVEAEMGVWPQEAPDKIEEVTLKFEHARCVEINGAKLTPVEAIKLANLIGGRNGVGISHALENRIIGTKSRGVYEAPGMELLGSALEFVYQAVLDRRAQALFETLGKHVGSQIYDGRWFDPSTRAAMIAIQELTKSASGTVKVGCYKGNVFFLGLKDVTASLYNEADSSMEKSDGLNPVSSQGFAEIQAVEAKSLARAGLINDEPTKKAKTA
ncbi:argininosuccinate synthase [Pavlovales sp. CCMP2436]|nr:argininosuccinate synthase [Pavlovales sp. CCMP2436]